MSEIPRAHTYSDGRAIEFRLLIPFVRMFWFRPLRAFVSTDGDAFP